MLLKYIEKQIVRQISCRIVPDRKFSTKFLTGKMSLDDANEELCLTFQSSLRFAHLFIDQLQTRHKCQTDLSILTPSSYISLVKNT